jgi:hypothetical protein
MLHVVDTAAGRWVIASNEAELAEVLPGWAPPPMNLAANDGLPRDTEDGVEIARHLMATNQPVAVLASPQRVLAIEVPATGAVTNYWDDGDSRFRFTIAGSPTVYTLEGSLLEKAGLVRDAFEPGTDLLVLAPGFDARPLVVIPWPSPWERPCREYDLDAMSMRPVSRGEAALLYDRIFRQDSAAPYATGIPFRLAGSYCEAKAEAMAQFLLAEGVDAGKAWVVSKRGHSLRVRTDSSPTCWVEWGHHVAVVVRSDNATERFLVFDPTIMLEGGVLSLDDWHAKFLGQSLPPRLTSAEAYYIYLECFQPTRGTPLKENAWDLRIARRLLAQFVRQHGRPPYQCPPAPAPT